MLPIMKKEQLTSTEQYLTAPFKLNFFPTRDTVPDYTINVSFPQSKKRQSFYC